MRNFLNDWYSRFLLVAGAGMLVGYLGEPDSLWKTIGLLMVGVGGGGAGFLWYRALAQSQPIWGPKRQRGPTHSDPDVQALLRKEITLLEYSDRKAEQRHADDTDIQPRVAADAALARRRPRIPPTSGPWRISDPAGCRVR